MLAQTTKFAALLGLLVLSALSRDLEAPDKYLWLEDVSGERAMAWVKAENERSAKILESDPRFAQLEATALKVLESPEHLPMPSLNGSDIYTRGRMQTTLEGFCAGPQLPITSRRNRIGKLSGL